MIKVCILVFSAFLSNSLQTYHWNFCWSLRQVIKAKVFQFLLYHLSTGIEDAEFFDTKQNDRPEAPEEPEALQGNGVGEFAQFAKKTENANDNENLCMFLRSLAIKPMHESYVVNHHQAYAWNMKVMLWTIIKPMHEPSSSPCTLWTRLPETHA